MDTHEQPPVSEPLRSTSIPIAQLSPSVERLETKSIHSTVTLLWPYSSSTKSFTLLLAEPDFRLRRLKGQVKVHFHGKVAEKVAKSQVGIGDNVYLSLFDSRFVKNDSAVQTPSKGVPWDMYFDDSVLLEVWRDSKLLSIIKIDRSLPSSPTVAPSTPVANGHSHTNGSATTTGPTSWQSPAFLNRSGKSYGFIDTIADPFVEEDGFVPGKGRKRPRFSIPGNGWRVINEPESPGERDIPADWTAMFDEDQPNDSEPDEQIIPENALTNGTSSTERDVSVSVENITADMMVARASQEVSEANMDEPTDQRNSDTLFLRPDITSRLGGLGSCEHGDITKLPTDTPRLQPIPSPGLPVPSPIVTMTNSPSGYFPSVVDAVQVQFAPPTSAISQVDSEREIVSIPHVLIDEDEGETPNDVHEEIAHQLAPLSETVAAPHETLESSQRLSLNQNIDTTAGFEASGVDKGPADGNKINVQSQSQLEATVVEEGHLQDESEEEPEDEAPNEEEEPVFEDEPSEEQDDEEIEMYKHQADMENSSSLDNSDAESEQMGHSWAEVDDELSQESHVGEGDHVREIEGMTEDNDEESVKSEIVSHKDTIDKSQGGRYYDQYDEEEYEDEDEAEFEEDYEEELDDNLDDDRYAESEPDSFGDDHTASSPAPKNTEPEIIVLDSDSEDELPSKQNILHAARESDELSASNNDYHDSEAEEYSMEDAEEIDDAQGIEEDDYEGDQEEYQPMEHEQEPNEHAGCTEPEQVDENLQDGDLADDRGYYTLEKPNMEYEEAVPTNQEQSPEYYEIQNPHGDSEEQVADIPLRGLNYESFDYLSTTTQYLPPPRTTFEPVPEIFDPAIDPKLYESENIQGANKEHVPIEQGTSHSVGDQGATSSRGSEETHERNLALHLDGYTSPKVEPQPLSALSEELIPIPVQQLITPGPSQPTETNFNILSTKVIGETPHTPDMSQTKPLQCSTDLVHYPPEETAGATSAAGDGSPSIEDAAKDIKEEEEENQAAIGDSDQPQGVHDTKAPPSHHEDQALQASIEVDEESQEGLKDRVCLVPVNRDYPGLRSKLSYFAPLATLIDHYNSLVDIIAIASEVHPAIRATTGKKDFILALQLTDPSMAGTTVDAQILRPYKAALPSLTEGDAILLRNFRVKSLNHSMILVSESTSAWAVFSGSLDVPQMNGPPVEYDEQEQTFATDLRQWYQEGGMAMVADNILQASVERASSEVTRVSSPALSDPGSVDLAQRGERAETSMSNRGSRRRKSQHRRITIHELRDGRRYAEVGSPSGKDGIHELRDGTLYANI